MNVLDQHHGKSFAIFNADTVEWTAALPDNSIDFSVYSPPFSSLYIYSDSERDMGNVENDEKFQAFYRPLVRDLFRVTKPGRLTAIHVKDLVYYSNSSARGDRGLRDFTGDCIRTHVQEGWTYHRRITIWRCPVREMQKTKSDRLLYKNFRTDGARTGGGLPEYIVVFRKWADGMDDVPKVLHSPDEYPLESWQHYAQPSYEVSDLWTDTDETNTLNAKLVRDDEAEKHICPMPLDLTERLIRQYSNPDETIFSPFAGIGSEGYVALRHLRRFVGVELSKKYYPIACRYLDEAERLGPASDLFAKVEIPKYELKKEIVNAADFEKKKKFIEAIVALSREHGLSLSHQDSEGSFLVKPYSENEIEHLKSVAKLEPWEKLESVTLKKEAAS